MEVPQRRDINELLTRGFFTTARGKSPNLESSDFHGSDLPSRPAPSHLQAHHKPRERSRSHVQVRRQSGPKPTAEDEAVSLARESVATSTPPSYDPPFRGIIDQVPILLEADVTPAEAARLQADPVCHERERNEERRFVFIPRSDTQSSNSNSEDEAKRKKESRRKNTGRAKPEPRGEKGREREKEDRRQAPPLERKRSRKDLPSLETKIPRDVPPQYRKSASSYSATSTDHDVTPKAHPRTPVGENFLSPDFGRRKDYFSTSIPRNQAPDSTGGRTSSRQSTSPGIPLAKKTSSMNLNGPRSRQNSVEKSTRPEKVTDENRPRNLERRTSGYSDRPSTSHSSRSNHSKHSSKHLESSEDDMLSSSDSDKNRYSSRGSRRQRAAHADDRHLRSRSRSNRSSLDVKPISRLSSPLVSPKVSPSQLPPVSPFERRETFPLSNDRNSSRYESPHSANQDTTPKPRLPSRPTIPPKQQATPYPENISMPIPIPMKVNMLSPDSQRTTSFPQYDKSGSSSTVPPSPYPPPQWQPPPFQPPPSSNLEKPVGSYRRYSEDIERGSITPLPNCPRMALTRGRNDWLTLPNCPDFDICPSCFSSSIAPTEFRNCFVQSAPRPMDTMVRCDFGSSPWYRIAWLLTLKERRRGLSLFYGIANIASTEQPCMQKMEAVRKWHGIIDPKTGNTIHNFDVCYNCVKSVETLLPSVRGVFVRKDKSSQLGAVRICDLRFDSKRFVQYFDALEVTADHANRYGVDPDTRDVASLAKRLAQIDECEHDLDLADRKWHVITQLPEFTICEECFDEVVWPDLDDGKAIPLLFGEKQVRIPKASCQLYSAKMRGIFRTAVDADDYKLLASKARERKTIEMAYKANVAEARRLAVLNPALAQKELKRLEDEWRRWE